MKKDYSLFQMTQFKQMLLEKGENNEELLSLFFSEEQKSFLTFRSERLPYRT